jgi:signal peptidase I
MKVSELKEALKVLKKTHKEIRLTGLKKKELEDLYNKYSKPVAEVPKSLSLKKLGKLKDKKVRKERKKKAKTILKSAVKKGVVREALKKYLEKRKADKSGKLAEQVLFNPDLLRLIGGFKKDMEKVDDLTFIRDRLEIINQLFKEFSEGNHLYGSKSDGNESLIELNDFINSVLDITQYDKNGKLNINDIKFVNKFFTGFFNDFVSYDYGDKGDVIDFRLGQTVVNKYSFSGRHKRQGYLSSGDLDNLIEILDRIVEHIDDCLKDPKEYDRYVELFNVLRDDEYYSDLPLQLYQIEWLEDLFPKKSAIIYEESETLDFDELEGLGYGNDEEDEEDEDWKPYKEVIVFKLK